MPTSPQPTDRCILLLCHDWSCSQDGIVGVNRTLAMTLSRYKGVKVYSTLMGQVSDLSNTDKSDAEKHSVTLIGLNPMVDQIGDSNVKIYSQLKEEPSKVFGDLNKKIPAPTHIIGHAPLTAEAAVKLKEYLYPQSKVILFYHAIPQELEWLHESLPYLLPTDTELVHFAEVADVVYSVTPKVHWYFTAKFRNRAQEDIDHRLFLPQCSTEIFHVNRAERQSDKPKILVIVTGEGIEKWQGADIAACALNKVNLASIQGSECRPASALSLGGVSSEQLDALKDSLSRFYTSPEISVDIHTYENQEKLLNDLKDATICIVPSRAEPFGYTGLLALSAGVPTLLPENSALASVIQRITVEPELFLVPITPDMASVRQDASVWRDRIITVLQDPDGAHERAMQLRTALRRDESIKESQDNFVTLCLGGIKLIHEVVHVVLQGERDEGKELKAVRAFNKFLVRTMKQCWRLKHDPLTNSDDLLSGNVEGLDLKKLKKRVTDAIENRDRRILGVDDKTGSFIVYCPTPDALSDLWSMCDRINGALNENLLSKDVLECFGLKGVSLRTVISGPEFLDYKRELTIASRA